MKLTQENYYQQSQYMSASQFKAFLNCEACALAEAEGEHVREASTALVQGQYVDAYFTGNVEEFRGKHPELFKKDGELKATYSVCESAIERIERDPVAMQYLDGEKQVIVTGEIEGVPCKGKLDVLHEDRIVDLKCMRDFAPVWKDGERLDFIRAWGYDIQAFFYTELVRQQFGKDLPFYILAVTKEASPDLMLVEIPDWLINSAGEVVSHYIKRFDAIKKHEIEPKRCGKCAYCKETKKLTGPMPYDKYLEEVML